jgi:LuxR family maltose regulon positive regulatory protein
MAARTTNSTVPPRTDEGHRNPAPTDWPGIIAAIDALLHAGLFSEAQGLIERYGEGLIRAGHVAQLERWNGTPGRDEKSDSSKALRLKARVLADRNALEALGAFQAAFDAATNAGDRYGAIQAACGLLQVIFVLWGDFRPVAAMVPHAEHALDDDLTHPDATSELECLTGLLAGWLLLRPDHPRRAELVERMFRLAGDAAVDASVRLGAGGTLLAYCQIWSEPNVGIALIERLDQVASAPGVPAGHRLTWERESALYYVQLPTPDPDACRARIDRHEAEMPADATAHHRFNLARLRYDLAFIERDFDAAEIALAAAGKRLDPRLPVQAISLAHMETKLALMRGQYRRAQVSAQQAVMRADQVSVPEVIANVYRVNCLMALTYCEEFDAARAVSERLLSGSLGRHRLIYETSAAVLRLVEARSSGKNIDAETADVLAAIERTGSFRAFVYNRPLGAEVTAHALEHDINAGTARRVVQTMRFDPPPWLPESWPWTVRIYAFGTPAIELDGSPLGGKARAQQRPIDLLLGIALAGNVAPGATIAAPGTRASARTDAGVDANGLMLALWPDADSDAKTAFDVTLLRLRKLLVHDGLVTLTDGKLRLDRRRVWCDAWAFEARVEAAEPLSLEEALALLRLYRGPLFGSLAGDGRGAIPAWAAVPRERLRSKFLRTIAQYGERAEAEHAWQTAVALYEQGIEQDTLAEDFYRGLMRCHLALGAPANALRAYRRCRELLSIVLSVPPTEETEALYRTIRA